MLCPTKISGALYQLGAAATVELATSSVAVQYDESKLTLEAIQAANEEQRYAVTGL